MKDSGKSEFQKLRIQREADLTPQERRVVKVDGAGTPQIQPFHFDRLTRPGEGSYAATKAKYGAISATDEERTHRNQRDRRFSLNPLLKEPLSIEEEERRVIDEKVRSRTEAIDAEVRAKAREEGFAEGLEQGKRAAREQFMQEAADRLERFEALIAAAENAKDEIFRANERFVMDLVFRIARMVTLQELSADRDYLLRLTRELIERTGVKENIRIRVHPREVETASMLKPGLEAALGELKNLSVEASESVGAGGCVVETEWNVIDATVEQQFAGIREALLGGKGAPSE